MDEERESFCIVERSARRLALPAGAVRRVLSGGTLTRVPGAPAAVVGLVNDRGAALPVVCIDAWLRLPVRPCASGDPVVLVEGAGVRFGLLVDRVDGIAPLADASPTGLDFDAESAPNLIGACRASGRGPVAVLDPDALAQAAVAAADAAFGAADGGRAA
ncbi:MAG: chemotaxis protein CheW [Deltaproteobacteria bacterium]|nr:chemotaxis protein CheW [Deltaproteobacteria bacterium]